MKRLFILLVLGLLAMATFAESVQICLLRYPVQSGNTSHTHFPHAPLGSIVLYVAVCVGVISGKRINIRGIWKGVDVQESDGVLNLTPINGAKTNSKQIRITDNMKLNAKGYVKVD